MAGADANKRRGRYKVWLRDAGVEIPDSTRRRWEANSAEEEEENFNVENEEQDQLPAGEQGGEFRLIQADANAELEDNQGLGDDERPPNDNGHPIFDGSEVTRAQALALTMAYAVRHNITGVGLTDLLTLLNTLVPGCVPQTKYYIDKTLYSMSDKIQFEFYCENCQCYLGSQPRGPCPDCDQRFHREKSVSDGCYFLRMPLSDQIRGLFEDNDMSDLLKKERTSDGMCYKDITDGRMYQGNELQDFLRNPDNLSFIFNTDGVPIFSSSNYSVWPILCTINELPLAHRSKFILLHSLWFGKSKPRMDTFLKPFVDEIQELYSHGVEWKDEIGMLHTSKCVAVTCVCDSVARPLLQNVKQFNGSHGCGFCLHAGSIAEKGRGTTRVYEADHMPESRTHLQTIQHARQAMEQDNPVFGVKGATCLFNLPLFDVIDGFTPDYMHSVLLGVTRQFVNIWFDSSNHNEPYYLGSKERTIDEALLTLSPPSEIRRLPRSLSEKRYWKASEWRSFLLLYSPIVLENVLPVAFFRHWLLLVNAMTILLAAEIKTDELKTSRLSLAKFVVGVPDLYGSQHVSFNCHLLTHLGDSVANWGPAWAASCFVFEDAAGTLTSLYHGTQHVPLQMVKKFLARQSLRQYEPVFADAEEHIAEVFQQLTQSKITRRKLHKLTTNCAVLGSGKQSYLTATEVLAIEHAIGEPCINRHCKMVHRFLNHGVMFTSLSYSEAFKRSNAFVKLHSGAYGGIVRLVVCRPHCTCANNAECFCEEYGFVFVKMYDVIAQPVVRDCDVRLDLLAVRKAVAESHETLACSVDEKITKVCLVESTGTKYIVNLPVFEFD